VFAELRNTATYFKNFILYLIFEDDIDACIGIFQTDDRRAYFNKKNVYEALLTNITKEKKKVLILFDIYSHDALYHPNGHHAYFEKWLELKPESSTKLVVDYDWNFNIKFVYDGKEYDCDNKWIGNINEKGRYSIRLVMFDEKKRKKSELSIVQDLV
jgi:hypothetical protein